MKKLEARLNDLELNSRVQQRGVRDEGIHLYLSMFIFKTLY